MIKTAIDAALGFLGGFKTTLIVAGIAFLVGLAAGGALVWQVSDWRRLAETRGLELDAKDKVIADKDATIEARNEDLRRAGRINMDLHNASVVASQQIDELQQMVADDEAETPKAAPGSAGEYTDPQFASVQRLVEQARRAGAAAGGSQRGPAGGP